MTLESTIIERIKTDLVAVVDAGADIIGALGDAAQAIVAEAAELGQDLAEVAVATVRGPSRPWLTSPSRPRMPPPPPRRVPSWPPARSPARPGPASGTLSPAPWMGSRSWSRASSSRRLTGREHPG